MGPLPPIGPLEAARRFVFDAVAGFGVLQPLLDDPTIEEVWINAPNEIYVARNGESELTSLSLTDQQVRDLVERMLKSSGRRLDMSSPFVDAALPDGWAGSSKKRYGCARTASWWAKFAKRKAWTC